MRMTSLVTRALASSCLLSIACSSTEQAPRQGGRDGSGASGGPPVSTSGGAQAVTGVGGTTSIDLEAGSGTTAGMEDCDNILEVTYRDFEASHPDMERANPGDVVRHNLVALQLGSDKKPVFESSVGCPRVVDTPSIPGQCDNWQVTEPVIESQATFDQWYRTTEGVNLEIQKTLELMDTGGGQYVFDSTSFFPLGPDEGYGIAPTVDHHLKSNFLFTTEIHVRFKYVAGQVFTFRGDDDLWIFVNNRLAMDLGSMHAAEEGTIDFDAQAAELNIVPGQSYDMDIFHAERHTQESNFRFQTNISCFEPVVIK